MKFITKSPYFETNNGDKILYPFGPPIFQSLVHNNFTKELIKEGRKLSEKDDWGNRLAGQHKYGGSYHYKLDFLKRVEPYLKTYAVRLLGGLYEQYGKNYNGINKLLTVHKEDNDKTTAGKIVLDSLWINFSQKHDYNPPHTHTGALSFVIYCQVPKEIFSVQTNSNTKRAGEIIFQFGEPISELMGSEYPIKPFEDLIFIFPAKLKHFVPGYWVDEERISGSGNFKVV